MHATFRALGGLCAVLALPALARDCRLDGEPLNLDNGSSTAGRSGTVTCRDDSGNVMSEQTLKDGRFIGFERTRDLWGNTHEREVNANGNTQGVAREFWPDGTKKSEAGYDDGDRVGPGRTWHRNGQLATLAYEDREGRQRARLEYDDQGALTGLQCPARSLLEEDRVPCGFAGAATTELHRRGALAEKVTYEQGRLRRHESFGPDGRLLASLERDAAGERRREFHPDGKPASETMLRDGFAVEEREWFMNGQLRSEVTREAKERDARSEARRWRDDGTLAEVEVRVGTRRVTTTRYDEAGREQTIEDFDADSTVTRRRRFDAQGRLVVDEYLHPDGSRRAPPAQIGGG